VADETRRNRFNGFTLGMKTVKTVLAFHLSANTLLKRGVNEIIVIYTLFDSIIR